MFSNIDIVKNAISYKFADFVTMFARGFALILLSLISAIKFGAVFLGIFPVAVMCIIIMVMNIKKYTIKEFRAYGMAGKIAQETLSSIRTVLSFGLQRRFINMYGERLQRAENMAIIKGFVTGLFSGISQLFTNSGFAIAMLYVF